MSESTKLGRRDVLKLGAAGLALGGCATTAAKKDEPLAASIAAADAFPTRVLGRTGIRVPTVSMGVMNADNPNLVKAALEGGMTLLDTAHVYQNGRNEEMIGTIIREGVKRDSFTLCTKIALSTLDKKTGVFSPQTRPEEIGEKLDVSLLRLSTDHVDILYLHNQSLRESTMRPDLLEALVAAKKAGKARFIGVSTHKNEPEVIRAAIEAKVYDVVLTSYNFRQDHHPEVQKAIGEAAAAGLGVVVMKTQAGVFWDKEKTNPINPRAALRWAIRDPNAHTAIPGFTTFDQLQDDLAVMREPQMTDADHRALLPPNAVGFYCQGCESCKSACPQNLPVPELMRSYMYAHAYRNREAAQSLVLDLGLPRAVCEGCASCPVECAKGFDVRRRIQDVVRLRDVPREFLI